MAGQAQIVAQAAQAAPPAIVFPAIWAALGVGLKMIFDSFFGRRNQVALEGWKIRARILEERLSEFYWPLYAALKRDELLWEKAFKELRAEPGTGPDWLQRLSEEQRRQLAKGLESDVILPNHLSAVAIIRDKMHLANADAGFQDWLGRYVRHVDIYEALRKIGIDTADPIDIGEAYPAGLSEQVKSRLDTYQAEYEALLRERGLLDLSTARQEIAGPGKQDLLSNG